jgi:type II secretory pathway predicted ATPase ExeA
MYESFYRLSEKPFSLIPDPAFLYQSDKHTTALSLFEYSLTGQAGFCIVTGEVGAGKTTLIRHFLQNAHSGATIGVISNPHSGFGDLLDWVAHAFNIPSGAGDKIGSYRRFLEFLTRQAQRGLGTVLVVDEAQSLTTELLEQLRLLSNVNADKQQLLQMILVGQPELLEKLKQPELRQFAQRISVHYHLLPLTYNETRNYIRHRLAVAGAGREIFDEMAVACVQFFTCGVPRLINSVCDMALVYGYANASQKISLENIVEVAKDRASGTLLVLPRTLGAMSHDDLRSHLAEMMNEAEANDLGARTPAAPPHEADFPESVAKADFASLTAQAGSAEAMGIPLGKITGDFLPVREPPGRASSSMNDDAPKGPPPLKSPTPRPLRTTSVPQVSARPAKRRRQWSLWNLP